MPDRQPGQPGPAPCSPKQWIALVAGPALCVLLLLLPAPAGMPVAAWHLVAVAAWMVAWWVGEAVPLPATALLPIPLLPLLGVADVGQVTRHFAHPLIFLFLGGFLLAAAMQRWGLHRRIALRIVALVGTSPGGIVAGFMAATAFLSMWISNTATTIMMYAVGVSVAEFVARRTDDPDLARRFGVALMLGIAYAASIGGVGTLIGTPPNALLASFLADSYGIRVDFVGWMAVGVPVVLVMLPLAWVLLTRLIYPTPGLRLGDAHTVIHDELAALGPMSKGERAAATVFAAAAAGWVLRAPLAEATGLPITDTTVAVVAALALFAWPVERATATFALDWPAAKTIPWGVLLLFGGGLALAAGFQTTGLAAWIGDAVASVHVAPWLLVLLVTAAIVALTELTSNTASTATFLPILGAVAVGLGLDPRLLAVPVALGASMAFMMPVATPPNAIVFSYDQLHLADMVRAGVWMNLLAVAVTFAAMMGLVPWVLGL